MNKNNIKILVVCHKPAKILENDYLIPIQVGCANNENLFDGMLHDNVGENISTKNPYYCELTAQYWAWKNLDADYYGFFHYRRYLNFSTKHYPTDCWGNINEDRIRPEMRKKYALDEGSMEQLICGNDIVISEEKDISRFPGGGKSVYEQYKNGDSLHIRDLDIVCEIIKEKYPDYVQDMEQLMNGKTTCLCNMFIMKKELFHEYMNWLFDILYEFERRADMTDYTIEGVRTPGHLAERLLTLFYRHQKKTRQLRSKELQTVVVLNTEPDAVMSETYQPAYETNNTAIALAANDYFVPYMATLLQSIKEHAGSDNNYDIIVLTQDITETNRQQLRELFTGYDNFKIRFIDPGPFIEGYRFFTRGHFSMETYYRLVLPELLPEYKKILYLDSDMVVEADVDELYQENIDGYLLAAAHDADTAGLYNGYEPEKKDYTDRVLKLKEPYQYFQAGTLLINLEEFRNTYTVEEILKFSVSEKWQLLDQDILNKLCEGRAKYIDMAWNMMVDFDGTRKDKIIRLAPKWLYDMYLEARKAPKIIHYAGPQKPWLYPEMDFGSSFWKYAQKTPCYEAILYRMAARQASDALWEEKNRGKKYRSIIGGGIRCIREHGFLYTLHYIPRRLGLTR